MPPLLFAAWYHSVFMVLMMATAIFLMLIVLVQRGRGGGLAGAFGGAGGQSAFGTKAGDLFTRVTIGVAAFWIVLCLVALKVMGTSKEGFGAGSSEPSMSAPVEPGEEKKEDGSGGDGADAGATSGEDGADAGATSGGDGAGSSDDAPAEKKD